MIRENKIKIGAVEYKVMENITDLGYDFHKAFVGFKTKRRQLTVDNFCNYVQNSDRRFICVPVN